MTMNNYLSMITLKVNGLNASIKRHRIAEWIRKHDPHICCLQESPNKVAAYFSMETLRARREWQKIFQVMRTRGLQPRLLYPVRLSIKIEGQIKSFPDKRSLNEYTSTKPALQEMLKGLL